MARIVSALMAVAAVALTVAGPAAAKPRKIELAYGTYIPTPAGYFLEECVHNLPAGATVQELDTFAKVTHADGSVERIEFCDTHNGARPMMLHTGHPDFPQGYDGWLEYTVAYNEKGYDTFLGDFSVPDTPQADPEVLYLFTGLQNINWIPITTPLPSKQFDIIQPVLQYPSDCCGNQWSVKSWWVTLQSGAFASNEVPLSVGDKVFGNMTRIGPQGYFIGSTSVQTGKATTTNYQNGRLANQPWAYNTLECYGCQGCATFPTKPCQFTKLSFTSENKPVTVDWKANPFPSKNRQCHESVDIHGSDAVTVSFQ